MSPYLFVIATVLALIPLLIIFKVSIERIKEEPKNAGKAQLHFMIGAAASEAIPLIIIVYSFANMTPVSEISELYLPGLIILLSAGIGSFFILLQRIVDVNEQTKPLIANFTTISFALTSSIPIISIIGLVLMAP